ncbi:phosphocarrier protein HPr [Thiohalorhabdus denitrificans]|uniref:Phosphocarrier protein n=1 Tax=Thiohalorhabdus denitrificans TaxID=381306 RepID=A0A0P9GLI4_9GAMM|nr:HPr family phosphocarrier protein [Thiohalorhabdus denitrificans]KPV41027.1 phosphocarrier protein HPr [Thiohalorhabdus denitrificans]SCY41142.1 phosphocarrier protein [Thiohalorhabdus denitrificans]
MIQRPLRIINKLGLHARAASKLVSLASSYESEVSLTREGQTVSAKSIMGVMMLGASRGTELELIAEGPDEEDAADAISELVEDRFGEGE